MESSEKHKALVGIVMVVLLAAMIVGLFSLGNRTLARGQVLFVDFDNTGNLKEGAEVRLSALRLGRVLAIRQGVGVHEPPMKARLRMHLWIEKSGASFIRKNSVLYINAKGPIGERYVEVGPPEGDALPEAEEGHVFRGIDAPLLDRLIQQGFENLSAGLELAHQLEPELRELTRASEDIAHRLEEIVPPDLLERLDKNARGAISEIERLGEDLRVADPRRLSLLVDKIASLSRTKGDELRAAAMRVEIVENELAELFDLFPVEERQRQTRGLERLETSLKAARHIVQILTDLTASLRQGRGTLGRFLTDPDIVDEIKQTHRILKESPWRTLSLPPRENAPRGRAPKRARQGQER
jgi:ABC-type transporter Mla subunit MlaD